MIRQLCKCRDAKPDGTGYTDCAAMFLLGPDECCPKCGGVDWREIDLVEIPEITKAHKVLETVMEEINKTCWPGDALEVKAGIAAAIRILEGAA